MTLEPLEAASDDRFGVGPFPSSLNVINWGAVLAAPLWILAHGVWVWLLVVLGFRFASVYARMSLERLLGGSLASQAFSVAIISVAWWILAVYFGTQANKAAWEAESRRVGSSQPRALESSVGEFQAKQAAWVRNGLLIVAFGHAWVLYAAWQQSLLSAAANGIGYGLGLLALGMAWIAFRFGSVGRSS